MLLAVSRVHETVPLFVVKGLKSRLGGSLRDLKIAVLGLTFKRDSDDVRDSLSYKLVRMLERELAHVARHDPHVPAESEPLDAALEGADAVVVATNHSAFEGLLERLPEGTLRRGPVERDRLRGGVRHGARARDRRVSRVLVTGGAGTIGSAVVRRLLRDGHWTVRVSDHAQAPDWMSESCEVHRGDLRDLATAREAMAGCTHVIHLAAIVGGIANFHRLPHTLLEVNNGLYNAVFRAALDERVERLVYVSSSMVFENATEFPTTEGHVHACPAPRSAYGFSKLAGEKYCLALNDEHRLPYTICRPFNAYGPGELPDDEPGHRARRAGPDPQGALGAAPARDLRVGQPDAHAHARGRHRRRHRHGHGEPGRRERGLQHLGVGGAHRRRDRRDHLGGRRARPGRVRAEAPAELRGGRPATLAVGREGEAAARLGGARRPARRHRRDRRLAARVSAASAPAYTASRRST